MTIHDWTRVPAGLFHHFHQSWSTELARTLNRSVLPEGYYSLVEQRVDGPEPDVIAVETEAADAMVTGGVATLAKPKTRVTQEFLTDAERYAERANRLSVRHKLGHVVAIIEIVSPGNKDSRHKMQSLVRKSVEFLQAGVHLLIVDLFPPTARDPEGIHPLIWNELADTEAVTSPEPLTLVSYQAGRNLRAYLEPVSIGQEMLDMPLFITPEAHILAPLTASYETTYQDLPKPMRAMLEV